MKLKLIHGSKKSLKLSKYENTKNIFLKNNKSYKFGEIFKNIPLLTHLKQIGKEKIKGFYFSNITKEMVNTLNELGGLHTEEDFESQKTIFSSTISNNYNKFKIHQCPLILPGIIVLLMMEMT